MAFESLTKILDHKIIPVVAIQDAGDALPLADALIEGRLALR
jgi:2-keto-3-deoxy-6-phosphogluconate aldolase